MYKKLFNIFVFLVLSLSTKAQSESVIIGYAPEFIGETVSLYSYSDYLTQSKIKIGEAIVGSDSLFKINNPVKQTLKALIEINKTESELYLQPKANYNIEYYKPKNKAVSFSNQKVQVQFYGLDSTDINYRILRYNQWFDSYIYYKQNEIIQHGFTPCLDTFKIYAYETYKNVKDPYFINYVRYNIANMELSKITRKNKNSKQKTYMEYIRPYPVYIFNDQYMAFIKGFYSKDFESYSPHIKSSVYLALDRSSPTRLMNALGKDPLLEQKQLRELMMVNMLGNSYYKRGYKRLNLITILDSVSLFSKYKPNAIAARNMLVYLTKLESGYPAPIVNIKLDENKTLNWGNFKGKYIYVNFFANWNQPSLNEMKIIKDLYYKYGDNIEFVSFCTDKSEDEFVKFKEKHSDYPWHIIYLGENHNISKSFNVKTIPAYYLIDQKGFMAQSPAKKPSPDGVYQSIDKTFFDITKEINRKPQRNANGSY